MIQFEIDLSIEFNLVLFLAKKLQNQSKIQLKMDFSIELNRLQLPSEMARKWTWKMENWSRNWSILVWMETKSWTCSWKLKVQIWLQLNFNEP